MADPGSRWSEVDDPEVTAGMEDTTSFRQSHSFDSRNQAVKGEAGDYDMELTCFKRETRRTPLFESQVDPRLVRFGGGYAQYDRIRIQTSDGCAWLGQLDLNGQCAGPAADVEHGGARLELKGPNQTRAQQTFAHRQPNHEVVERRQRPKPKRRNELGRIRLA